MHHGSRAPVCVLKLAIAFCCLFGRDHGENITAVDVPDRLCNDGIASAAVPRKTPSRNSWTTNHHWQSSPLNQATNFPDQDSQASWCGVELRIAPDEQNVVKDWLKQLLELLEIGAVTGELVDGPQVYCLPPTTPDLYQIVLAAPRKKHSITACPVMTRSFVNVDRNFTLSFASSRASSTSFCSFEKGAV